MSAGTDHELIAGYALNALDCVDHQRFETHLAECTICAEELGSLSEAAASLSYALDDELPQADLREQILKQTRGEQREPVAAWRYWRVAPSRAAALAAAAVLCAATATSVWAIAFRTDGEGGSRLADTIAAVVADPKARSIPLDGYAGRLVVAPGGSAVLVAGQFPPARKGERYEIWVTGSLEQPRPAGSFRGGRGSLILLTRHVPKGAEVSVTREARDVPVPTGPAVAYMNGTA
jgi:Anti-sigma-K factor rskA